jgi:hypothetical protein
MLETINAFTAAACKHAIYNASTSPPQGCCKRFGQSELLTGRAAAGALPTSSM